MKISLSNSNKKSIEIGLIRARRNGCLGKINRLESILLLSIDNMDYLDVAKLKGVQPSTIIKWVYFYTTQGLSGLLGLKNKKKKTKIRKGRKPRLSEIEISELKRIIDLGPQNYHKEFNSWTLMKIQVVVKTQFGKFISTSQLSRILKASGITHKKAKFKLSKQDEAARKTWIDKTFPRIVYAAKKEGAAILFCDEVGFSSSSDTTYTWSSKGKQVFIPHPGVSYTIKAFGAVDIISNKLTYHIPKKNLNTATFRDFLKIILKKYKEQKVYLIADNVGYHKSKELMNWLKPYDRKIDISYLPAYSPDFNPIEQLWKIMKQRFIYNSGMSNKKDLERRVLKMFRSTQTSFSRNSSFYQKWSHLVDELFRSKTLGFKVFKGKVTDFLLSLFSAKNVANAA